MAKDSQTGKDVRPVRAPYALKRTIQKLEHNGQEYLLDSVLEQMSNGHKINQAIRFAYPQLPTASVPALATKIKKHPYFVAYKEASLKLLQEKGAALQQNMLDLAFNSRSDMVKFSATKDAMDRVYGEANDIGGEKPTMIFNFQFGDNPPKVSAKTVIDGEVIPE